MASVSHNPSSRPGTRRPFPHIARKFALILGCLAVLVPAARPTICFASGNPGGRIGEAGPTIETIHYDSGRGTISAILAKPEGNGKHPSIILIHDSLGLSMEFRNLAREFAAAGFLTLAPDLLTRVGGTQSSQQAESATAALRPEATVEDLLAGVTFLRNDPNVDPDRISSVGFGWGGWRSFRLASTLPELRHAVIFYGATPIDGLENIHASVLANYAQYDFFDTGNSIWTDDRLKRSGTKFVYYIYPKTSRGFFDPESPNYDSEAAKIAWSRCLEFLRS